MLLLIVDSYYRTGLTQPNQAEAERCGIGRESVFFSLACWIVKDPDAMQGRVAVFAAALLLRLLTVTEAAQVVVIELARRDREGRDRRSGWGGRMAGSTSISSLGWGRQLSGGCGDLRRDFLQGLACVSFVFLLLLVFSPANAAQGVTHLDPPAPAPRTTPPEVTVFRIPDRETNSAEGVGERLPRTRRAEAQQPHLKQAKGRRRKRQVHRVKCFDRACVGLGPRSGHRQATCRESAGGIYCSLRMQP